ncbi:MAG: PH domain-containing protein [Chloroflexi bacterium]|nr:PH domain-containing protein [Chloroflexota bacterium]
MQTKTFKPSPKYLSKLRLVITIVALLILAGGALIGWLMSLDPKIGASGFRTVVIVIAILDALWWVPGMLLTGPYYRSLSYEVQDDEVIVHVGIWTKSVKHVPYRTVTNLTVKRDILDRWLGLGTMDIQTAGMSGQTGAEEKLVGLPNAQEVYELVVTELRRFRGGMAPTAAEVEGEPAAVLNAILAEVRAIRQALQAEGAPNAE